MPKRIGIVGATGLIGGAFAQVLSDQQVVTLGRDPRANRYLDLAQPSKAQAFADLDLLIHAASVRDEDVKHDTEQAMLRSTVLTRELYRQAFAAGVSSVIHISTAHVYGPLCRTIDESSPAAPLSDYAIAHYAAERTLVDVATRCGGQALIVRPNAVCGMSFDPQRFCRWSLVPFAFPKAALAGKIAVAAPKVVRNFIVATTLAKQALLVWSQLKEAQIKVLNPLGADTLTMREFAELCAQQVERLTGKRPELDLAEQADPASFAYASGEVRAPPGGELLNFVDTYLRWLQQSDPQKRAA